MTQPRNDEGKRPDPIPGARLLFSLDPAVAHLNHGSYGAVPIPVQRAQQRLRDEMDANPMRFFSRNLAERVARSRRHLATFLGADPEGTAVVPNATAAAGIVATSVDLRPGDEVLVTDHGYGAVTMNLARAAARSGARLVTAAIPGSASDDAIVAAITSAATPRTRLAVIDHITSATALLFPIARIVGELRAAGIPVLVDAAHVPGMLAVDVEALGADFWTGNLHKWAYAPRGTAVLVVAPRWRPAIRPAIVSWEDARGFPASVEWQGTLDYTPALAAPTGVDTLLELGWAAVRDHNAALAGYGQRVIAEALGVPADDLTGSPEIAMRPIPLPSGVATTEASAVALRERISDVLRTEVAVNPWRGGGILRVSAQVYNTAAEYERLAEGLPGLLR